MKAIINGVIYDSNEVPVVLFFNDDEERQRIGAEIVAIPETSRHFRLYALFPEKACARSVIQDALKLVKPTPWDIESTSLNSAYTL